jgi:hypothetical protein
MKTHLEMDRHGAGHYVTTTHAIIKDLARGVEVQGHKLCVNSFFTLADLSHNTEKKNSCWRVISGRSCRKTSSKII